MLTYFYLYLRRLTQLEEGSLNVLEVCGTLFKVIDSEQINKNEVW